MAFHYIDEQVIPYSRVFDTCEKFVAHYRNSYCDFVYDAKSGFFYTDFDGPHTLFMANLYQANGGKVTGTSYDMQDAFVMEGMGLFKSRAGNRVLASANFELPDDLWFIKRDLEYV